MYNEERKVQFIESTRSSSDFGRSVFRTTGRYEEAAGTDFCELPLETVQEIINGNFGARTRSMDSYVAFLRSYVVWCKDNGYETCDAIYDVQSQMDEKIRRRMVSSPRHLQATLDKVFQPVESNTVDCIYRCYLWMAFAGITEEDALDIKVSEVDFSSMLIEHGGKSYELYREAIPAFRMACDATEFVYEHPRYKQTRNRCAGEYLMRGIRSEQVKLNTVKSIIQKAFKAHDVELTYGKLRLSGVFYRVYEAERMGDPVNFDTLIADHISKMGSTYHTNYTRSKVAGILRRDLFDDYACWKAVFT